MNTPTTSAARTLRRFSFRQTRRSAIIIGILGGLMMGTQGAAYAAAYPNQHDRDMFVASLATAPALGFMSGEIQNASSPAAYAIYKSLPIMTLIVAIWGLMTTTKLLRGQEEDGRLEPILASRTTLSSTTIHTIVGYSYSFGLAFIISLIAITLLGMIPDVKLSLTGSLLLTLSVYLPGIFFASLGVITSQLALSRGRALAYGIGILLLLFTLRGAANSITDWNDLKAYTPFGWSDLLNPVLNPQIVWMLPTLIFAFGAFFLAVLFTKKRDLGGSILPESQVARSHYYLLQSDVTFSLRRSLWPFIWWTLGAVAYAGLLASIAKVGADALSSSPQFAKIITTLGGSYDQLVISFLGLGGVFTVLILLVMAAVMIGNIRHQEAKGYADTVLVQPVHRSIWLASKIGIICTIALIISLIVSYTIWQIAANTGISLDLWTMLQNGIALIGSVILITGVGTLFIGFVPRIAAIIMYIAIIWAFVVDIIKSLLNLNDSIDKTSLLHYVAFTPTKYPDWTTFAWLSGIGLMFIIIGVWRFTKRDLVSE